MSERHDDTMLDLAEEYALGMLAGDDLRQFEAELERDPGLRASVAASRDALASMGYAIPVRPDAALRDRVLRTVVPTPAPAPAVATVTDIRSRRRVGVGTWMSLAAIAAAAVIITKLAVDLRDTREQAAAAEVRVAARDLELARRDSLIAQLADPTLESVSLVAATGREPAMRVYIDRRRRVALLTASAIDSLPAGRAYQLWFFVAGVQTPVPSVAFNASAGGTAMVTGVELPEGVITATAITVEPEGGSPAPTSPAVFAGSFETSR